MWVQQLFGDSDEKLLRYRLRSPNTPMQRSRLGIWAFGHRRHVFIVTVLDLVVLTSTSALEFSVELDRKLWGRGRAQNHEVEVEAGHM